MTDGAGMINFRSVRGTSRLAAIAVFATSVPANRAAPPQYQIAFTSFAPFDIELFVADSDGTNATQFLSSPGLDFDASFSADAKWVIFASTRDGNADIYRAHPDGSALEKLVTNAAYDGQSSLSPDGPAPAQFKCRTRNVVSLSECRRR